MLILNNEYLFYSIPLDPHKHTNILKCYDVKKRESTDILFSEFSLFFYFFYFYCISLSSTFPQPPGSGKKEGKSVKERVEARSVDSAVRC